nr:MAG TPA: bacterioferritin-associated protein [Caudoviricetes sp.]
MLVEIFLKYVCLCCFWDKNNIRSAVQGGAFTFKSLLIFAHSPIVVPLNSRV